MWAEPTYNIEDNTCLAEISNTSREWAQIVLDGQVGKANAVRLWMFELIQEIAQSYHGANCSCPLEDVSDPVLRVRAAALAVHHWVASSIHAGATSIFQLMESTGTSDLSYQLVTSKDMLDCVVLASEERAREMSARQRRWTRLASNGGL